jgi:4-diphosphocytidyl-2-C-methyl-D-erythritol kinase
MSMLIERAPAKVNLTLHLLRRRADGWHDLESLVAFAGCGDTLTLEPGAATSLAVDGPTAQTAGSLDDNLVLKAARALQARVSSLRGGAFHLTKRLPAAAGIGGGSSDAAAALRLLARANGIDMDDPRLRDAAQEIGSDVPVCLAPRARMMSGRGETLGPALVLPPFFAVLVNPRVPLETKAVFARIGLAPGEEMGYSAHPPLPQQLSSDALLAMLRRGRNDMEDAASVLAPVVGHVIAVLSAARGCRLARMSGSGATCFALFDTCRAAARTAAVIRRDHPEWWVKATVLR